ncbi:MAG TPA: hypothetical protein VLX68_13140 [Chitinivibrionales bacterium]|nr:hypothetical protein [Chitinivibrionales bacterium]
MKHLTGILAFQDVFSLMIQVMGCQRSMQIELLQRESFIDEYEEYLEELEDEGRALNTIANHKSAIQTTLKHAEKKEKNFFRSNKKILR